MYIGRKSEIFRILLLIAVAGLFAVPAAPALASVCTLADHIKSANPNTALGFCAAGTGPDIITIAEDLTLSEARPAIRGTITIEGGGHTISGDHKFRIFDVNGGNLTIKNLTLAEGSAPDANGAAVNVGKGASLTVENSSFRNNKAGWGGAIATTDSSVSMSVRRSRFVGNTAETGGAIIINGGQAEISGSSFQSNEASNFGGAIETSNGRANISNSSFQGNRAYQGGAILVSGARATLTHLTFVDNIASGDGDSLYKGGGRLELRNSLVVGRDGTHCDGGLDQSADKFSVKWTCAEHKGGDPLLAPVSGSPAYFPLRDGSPAVDAADPAFCLETDQIGTPRPQGGGCDIGAFESKTAAPSECTLADRILSANSNTSVGNCPAGRSHDIITLTEDITLTETLPPITGTITIEGEGQVIDGDRKFRIFDVRGRRLTLNNLTVKDAQTGQNDDGGAIRVGTGGRLNVYNSSFINNSSGGNGGAIWMEIDSHSLAINSSRFIGNKASYGGSVIGSALAYDRAMTVNSSSFVDNGGLYDGGAISAYNDVLLNIANSTFSNNRSYAGGSVLDVGGWAKVTLTHLTMMDNRTTTTGSSISRGQGNRGWLRLRNSVIAGGDSDRHCPERLTENSGNLFADGSCASSGGGDPLLGELSGAPGYHSLLDGSPAIDAADLRYCLETDQVGQPRPQGGGCDIGAIESPDGSAVPPAHASASFGRARPSTQSAGLRAGLMWNIKVYRAG